MRYVLDSIQLCGPSADAITGPDLDSALSGNVSAAGPDAGMTCFLYSGRGCTGGQSDPIVYPGYGDLNDPLINFNNKAQSFRCWKWAGYLGDLASD